MVDSASDVFIKVEPDNLSSDTLSERSSCDDPDLPGQRHRGGEDVVDHETDQSDEPQSGSAQLTQADPPEDSVTGFIASRPVKRCFQNASKVTFPYQLWDILQEGTSSILSWHESGLALILNTYNFNNIVQCEFPGQFGDNRLVNFCRQLRTYDFKEITPKDPNWRQFLKTLLKFPRCRVWYHRSFRRESREDLYNIVRVRDVGPRGRSRPKVMNIFPRYIPEPHKPHLLQLGPDFDEEDDVKPMLTNGLTLKTTGKINENNDTDRPSDRPTIIRDRPSNCDGVSPAHGKFPNTDTSADNLSNTSHSQDDINLDGDYISNCAPGDPKNRSLPTKPCQETSWSPASFTPYSPGVTPVGGPLVLVPCIRNGGCLIPLTDGAPMLPEGVRFFKDIGLEGVNSWKTHTDSENLQNIPKTSSSHIQHQSYDSEDYMSSDHNS